MGGRGTSFGSEFSVKPVDKPLLRSPSLRLHNPWPPPFKRHQDFLRNARSLPRTPPHKSGRSGL